MTHRTNRSASTFAERCGVHDAEREAQVQACLTRIRASGIDQVRIAWCDLHGVLRGKTLMANAVEGALRNGLGMVSTLMLKDSSDRTAYPVFERGGTAGLPAGFEQGNNLTLLPDPASLATLPWSPQSGWMRAQPWFANATPVTFDTRHRLQAALAKLAQAGLGMVCGLEIEFHIYSLCADQPNLNPNAAAWPGLAPEVALIHPGYQLLSEAWYDRIEAPMRIVQHTAQAMGLPLSSLEVEFGPSQVEAVFEPTDALTAADNMVRFRHGVSMALRRAGYHATFMARPPFAQAMASGWHLHQSYVALGDAKQAEHAGHAGRFGVSGSNAMQRLAPAPGSTPLHASHTLSDLGEHALAGLLAHARGMTALATPTATGYARYRPNALAPNRVLWGRDNRGALLRVLGGCGDAATRIENRLGEPSANPYLVMAAQAHAVLAGVAAQARAPLATESPYEASMPLAGQASSADPSLLPSSLDAALQAFAQDTAMQAGFGEDFVRHYARIKGAEAQRFADAPDPDEFARREYFGRI